MARSIAKRRPFTAAIVTHLSTHTGQPVGVGQAPDYSGTTPVYPYCVVYTLDDRTWDGPIADGQADAYQRIQVTVVGKTQEQCEALADLVHDSMLNQLLPTVDGRRPVLIDLDDGGQVLRDDAVQPPVFFAPLVFEILTTPTS